MEKEINRKKSDMAKILIIDDDETMCYSLSRIVKRMGHDSDAAATMSEGLKTAQFGEFDAVFLDVRLPDGNGLELLPLLEGLPSSPEVIIITGLGDPDGAELAMINGAWDYIEKTASTKKITLTLDRALQYRNEKMAAAAVSPVKALIRDKIIGNSTGIKTCLDLVARSAVSEANVLITGETGTGKELFARAIHDNSLRSQMEFVVLDCASIPETLVESLLFGHKKGAFTGADKDRRGLVIEAHQGTLFLDEVGELPMHLQKAFLRVLQERTVRPLGSREEIKSDFRLVAATNRDLEQMVTKGSFRSDLLFRIRSFCLELPPLRERIPDIREISTYHINAFCERFSLNRKGVSSDFFEVLEAYTWPGNIRELVNTIEQTLAAARYESILYPKHLPAHIRARVARARLSENVTPEKDEKMPPYDLREMPGLQEFRDSVYSSAEKKYLEDLIKATGKQIKEACRISGLSQSRLYALLKKHDITS